jgi:DNA adenine methylase
MPEQQLTASNVQSIPETPEPHVEVGNHAEGGSPRHQPDRRLRSPLVWFGGKGILARKIVPLFPPHHCYVEPFCGGASCLFAKAPSPVEVINDLNSDLVNFFRVLRDPGAFERFHRLASLTPYSREEFKRYRASWRAGWEGRLDAVERAYRWYVIARMSFAGEFGRSWGHSVATSRGGMANAVAQWLSSVDMLPLTAARLRRVQIEHSDWRDVIERYDSPGTLFYVDPPFVRATRRSGRYVHELDDAGHKDLVRTLLRAEGKIIVSGYQHKIYRPLEEESWERIDLTTMCYAAGRTRLTGLQGKRSLAKEADRYIRTQALWISPSAYIMTTRRPHNDYVQGALDLVLDRGY